MLEEAGVETIRATCSTATPSHEAARRAERDLHGRTEIRNDGCAGSSRGRMNTLVPAYCADRYRDSRIVAFSTGNVYPLTPIDVGRIARDRHSSRRSANTRRRASVASACSRLYVASDTGRACDRSPQLRDRFALRRARRHRDARGVRSEPVGRHGLRERHLAGRRQPRSRSSRCRSPHAAVRRQSSRAARICRCERWLPGSASVSSKAPRFTGTERARRAAEQHEPPAIVVCARLSVGVDAAARMGRRLGRTRRTAARQTDKVRGTRWQVLSARALGSRACGAQRARTSARRTGRFRRIRSRSPSARTLDERRQRGLTRYYIDAGAGGVAVGVHTTQFAIRDSAVGLFARCSSSRSTRRDAHAGTAAVRHDRRRLRPHGAGDAPRPSSPRALGYDAGLLSLGGLADASERRAARALPRRSPRSFRCSGSTCSRRSAGACCRYRVLARVRRDPERLGHQDRAVQPLSDASTWCARSSRPAATTSRCTRATTTTSSPICSRPFRCSVGGTTRAALDRRRAARPVGGVDARGGRAARGDQGARASRRVSIRRCCSHGAALTDANAAVFDAAHGFRRLHPGHSRSAAPPGIARRDLVSRSGRRRCRRARPRRSRAWSEAIRR